MNGILHLLKIAPAQARPVLEAIVLAQRRYALFTVEDRGAKSPAPVVVGLSGGADSVCLTHAMQMLAPHWNLAVHAVHVDHGLRRQSIADAQFAEHLALELGAEFHLRHLDGRALRADACGTEAAARAMRYQHLAGVARELSDTAHRAEPGALAEPTVAVAHHMDDQAETLLMNFVRGSGLRGLAGMPWKREIEGSGGVRLVRPLLGVRRSQLLDYLNVYGLEHVEDETNRDTSVLRNRVRHMILPALAESNPQIVETLARTAQLLGPEAERAEELDRRALASIVVVAEPPHRSVLDLAHFARLSIADRRGALRSACEHMGLDLRNVGFEVLDELAWRACEDHNASGPHTLAADVVWTVLGPTDELPACLSIHRRSALPVKPDHPHLSERASGVVLPYALACPGVHRITPDWSLHCTQLTTGELPVDWKMPGNPWRVHMDADSVEAPVLTVPAAGVRFSPLGMPGQHKSLGDYFTDRKTPSPLRAQWPIVVEGATGAVLWVCGHTLAHQARVTPATRRVLCLEWLPAMQRAQVAPAASVGQGMPCAQT